MTRLYATITLPERVNILGVGVHALDPESTLAILDKAIRIQHKGYVCFASVHGVVEAQRDRELMEAYHGAMLVTPDGMPLAWVGRLKGNRHIRRVAGPDLMLEMLSDPRFARCRHFLCGGDYGVAEELRRALLARFPNLCIAGTFTPPFRAMTFEEEHAFIEAVHGARPDIVWVGLGAPKQEKFMRHYLPLLDTTLMLGVGAAFLIHTGRIADSPRWVKRAGLQWLHRFIQEPLRLWQRYLINNPRFVCLIALQFLKPGQPLPEDQDGRLLRPGQPA